MTQLRKKLAGFESRDNTLSRTVKDYAPDRIELEIGDSKEPGQFIPQAKIMRWDNEVNLSVRRQKPQPVGKAISRAPVADVQGDHVTYDDDDETVHIYERPEVGEDGGLEIELHLKHKPGTNRFDFSIQAKGLTFHYQRKLTEEEVAEGAYQPENAIGSYAVYHATKRDNRVGGKEYKTGKFCHIYRPHITDAEGNETWGELELDEQSGLLTVVVPQAFLDTAVYPVVVDPTFGYTGTGSNWKYSSAGNGIKASAFSVPVNALISDVSGYFSTNTSTNARAFIYKATSLTGSQTINLMQASSEKSANENTWQTFGGFNTTFDGGEIAMLGMWFEGGGGVWFDTVSGYDYYDPSDTYSSSLDPSDPLAFSVEVAGAYASIYATYTDAVPQTVTTQAVTNIAHTTATGNGNVTDDGGFTITERGVCWSTSPVPTTADSKVTSAGTTGAFTASITGLSPDTTYYVRAYAINSEGTGYGAEVSFTTLPIQSPSVSTDAVSAITDTNATGNGEITNVNGNDANERGFVYDTTSKAKPSGGGTTLLDSESFETNLGDWSNAVGNDIDWTRDSGGTPSGSTGPSSGQDGSFYIFVETSSRSGNEVSIIEYDIGVTKDGYVDFYYHQYGDDQGTLYLEGWDGSTWTTIWSSTGDQGNQWNNVGQAATEFSGYSKLRFRNVHDAGGSFNGDIALDNINVYEVDPTPAPGDSDYTSFVNETGTYSTGTYSLGLTGLIADTTYYVRAYAKNSEGYSYADTEVSFTTTSGISNPDPLLANQGSYTTAGKPVTLTVNRKITANQGTYTQIGQTTALRYHRIMALESGTYTLNGLPVYFLLGAALIVQRGTYGTTGQPITFRRHYVLLAESGQYSTTGSANALNRRYSIAPEAQNYTTTGFAVGLRVSRHVVAEQGAYSHTGNATDLLKTLRLAADQGSYSTNGNTVTFRRAYRLVAETATYTTTGFSVRLPIGEVFAVHPGTYTTTGQSVGLTTRRKLTVETGTYQTTGQEVVFSTDTSLGAAPGTYETTGFAVTLTKHSVLPAASGTYTMTGTDVDVLAQRTLSLASGTYQTVGSATELHRTFVVSPEAGTYVQTGQPVDFVAKRLLAAEYGQYTLAGQAVRLAYQTGRDPFSPKGDIFTPKGNIFTHWPPNNG